MVDRRHEAAPPRRLGAGLVVLSLIWAAGTLWLFSDGAVSMYVDMVVLYVGASLVGTAAILTLVAGGPRPGRTRTSGWRRWLPLVFAAALVGAVPSLCRYGVPFSARLKLSEEALTGAAMNLPESSAHASWIGALRVERVERQANITRFTTGACGLAQRCGIAHLTEGRPASTPKVSYKPLRGPWWVFEQR